ncbi:MAG: DUF4349 domain-containing protein [Pseudomonadota bacterium]|nr:DUF4349 domain-containing protein [Pseudomonadota bacterium]
MKFSISLAVLAAALSASACSQQEDVALESADQMAPDISPTAAPGVAFTYAYDFKLADTRISILQEAHASECEKLGLTKCRITGLRYSVGENDQVSAMLQVKLDPKIARQFGKVAVGQVEQSGGRLVNAEFTGDDEGAVIQTASSQSADLDLRIVELERRLASLRAGDRERTQLQAQLDQLRREASDVRQRVAASEQRLATAPMTFNYYGRGGIPGFGGENPIAEAWQLFIASAVTMISVLLRLIGAVLPWALLLLLIVLAFRSRAGQAVRRWWRGRVGGDSEEA